MSSQQRQPGIGVKDPLLKKASKRVGEDIAERSSLSQEDDIGVPDLFVRVSVLAGGPSALYVFMLLVVVLFYEDWPMWVLITFLLTVVKCFLVARFFGGKRWRRWLGILLAVASTTGMLAGLLAYYEYLVYYNHYKAATPHANVAASEDALRFTDGGLVQFAQDSLVDASRSVGYQSARKNAKICLAPVVDSGMAPSDPVAFFAVGTDCCDWRAGFRCGDANDASAHGGALWLSLSSLVSEMGAWSFEDMGLEHGLWAALHLEQAVFSTVLANNTRFIHWAKDPVAVQDAYLNNAVRRLVLWSILFVLGLTAAAGAAASGWRNVRMVTKKGRDVLDVELPHEAMRTRSRPGRVRTNDWLFSWL